MISIAVLKSLQEAGISNRIVVKYHTQKNKELKSVLLANMDKDGYGSSGDMVVVSVVTSKGIALTNDDLVKLTVLYSKIYKMYDQVAALGDKIKSVLGDK